MNNRYLISNQGSLVILQTQLEDRGTYKAIVSNGAGTFTAETRLYFFFDSACRSGCLNGGECLEISQCSCPQSYAGRYCEIFVGVTEAPTEETRTQDVDNLLPTPTEMTPPLTTSPDLELNTDDMYVSGSGSGSGSQSHSESEYLGSGDVEKEVHGSGLEELEEDGATLSDDEDFGHAQAGVVGGAAAKRRRRRSLHARSYGFQQDRHINNKVVEERAQNEVDADRDVVPLPIKDGDAPDFVVFEYEDRYDSRGDMLKFER